jgi:hypothetical protein
MDVVAPAAQLQITRGRVITMAKQKEPVGGGAPTEPDVTTVFANTSSVPQTAAIANRLSIRRGPGGKADRLVSISGLCTDTPMRERKLRRSRRFSNVLWYRFGINFDPMPQSAWSAIVEAAIAANGGAA